LLTGWAKLFRNVGIREFAMSPGTHSSVELIEQLLEQES